ncbi:MAG: class I SAM-dependent methyltransferase [Planctomycetaceae bacterium]|nr:class I SAM-dependent methyltransferase [Planctomycetaceae bacterium]
MSNGIPLGGWRESQREFRERWIAEWSAEKVAAYQLCAGQLDPEQRERHVRDLLEAHSFRDVRRILDVGSGAGTVCEILADLCSQLNQPVDEGGPEFFALEPAPEMLRLLVSRMKQLGIPVQAQEGFCDSESDIGHYPPEYFDLVISRQVTNGLYDPLGAFANWKYWLRPGGTVIVMDGLFDRAGWGSDVDLFPLAATKSLSTVPYLLEQAGFCICSVGMMSSINAHPLTRTPRYLVVAQKP